MIQTVKFRVEHFEKLKKDIARDAFIPNLSADQLRDIERSQFSYSIIDGERILLVGGLAEYWEGRGEAWAHLNAYSKKDFVILTRHVRRYLDSLPHRRIEASVEVDFKRGRRWVKALGFTLEVERLRKFLPNGKDCAMYARVK